MRLPSVPGPRDLKAVVERAGEGVEQLFAILPRVTALLTRAEQAVAEVAALVARIEETRLEAAAVVSRTDETRARADALIGALEPSLTQLQPTLERLAETTHPDEVDALVQLIDHLPQLVEQVERDLLPVMRTLGTVAPDVHDLLDVSRELNGMLGQAARDGSDQARASTSSRPSTSRPSP